MTGKKDTPEKPNKPASLTKYVPIRPKPLAIPGLSSTFQTFHGAGAIPHFSAPTVAASPTLYPHFWVVQNPFMPHYATQTPYPRSIFPHPNIPMTRGPIHGTAELDRKNTAVDDRTASKRIKGNSGNHSLTIGKTGNIGKTAASVFGNDTGSQSSESRSESSLDESDSSHNQELSSSTSNLLYKGNQGMISWNPSTSSSAIMKFPVETTVSPTEAPPARMMMNNSPAQDEPDLETLRRRRSSQQADIYELELENRSATDELRKHTENIAKLTSENNSMKAVLENYKLQFEAERLARENHALKDELQRLSENCEKLTSENNSIKEELTTLCGPDAVSKFENRNSSYNLQTHRDENNR